MTRADARPTARRSAAPDQVGRDGGRASAGTAVGRPDAGELRAGRRAAEVRAVTVTVTVLKFVATACVLIPALDRTVTGVLAIAVVIAAGWTLLRLALRRVRWWVEDRLDDRVAAAWRAERRSAAVDGT